MWPRNLLFIAVCIAGVGLLNDRLFRGSRIELSSRNAAEAIESSGEWKAALDRLDAEFRRHWDEQSLDVAPRAADLAVARRLSLALVGTVPSLEEVRALEAVEPQQRVSWWTSHL